jgi:hypothetical protein
MQSDVLPFTLYDTMDYAPVGMTDAPPGFQKRDAPTIQSRREDPPIQQHPGSGSGGSGTPLPREEPTVSTGGGGGKAVKQKPEEDIDLGALGFENMERKGQDIGNSKKTSDLWYIIIAVLVIDVIVLILCRFLPEVFGQALNRWYDLFGLSAVIADVLIIVIGFLIARYLWTGYVKDKYSEGQWSPLKFTGLLVGTQLIHDLAFYFGIIKQIPRGSNLMMDVFKDYAESGGAKILFGDAAMMVGSSLVAMSLKSQPFHIVASVATVAGYLVPYLLYSRNQYSVTR